ncbi:MAG TPA: hypothetical protein VK787_00445 [Puia sp.]|jgi:hypothetical protein|nr:hypothetical protein [Puia sp.]
MVDLKILEREKPAQQLMHPHYDNFGKIISKQDAINYLRPSIDEKIILFSALSGNIKGFNCRQKNLICKNKIIDRRRIL